MLAYTPYPIGKANNNPDKHVMNNHQLKQARRDREDKQTALYGCPLVFTAEKARRSIRWSAVVLAVCLGGFLWIAALAIIDSLFFS